MRSPGLRSISGVKRRLPGWFLILFATTVQVAGLSAVASAGDHPFGETFDRPNPYRGLFEIPPIAVPPAAPSLADESFAETFAQNQPPPVEHTGWSTLLRSTVSDFKAFPRRKSTYVILGI